MSLQLRHDPTDGSIALYVGGDLQFDSRDEHVYHEALAVPGLAVALARHEGPLRALILGGGDGLALRELLKSERVGSVQLIDHDPRVLALARGELAGLNRGALADPRVKVSVGDARAFVEGCETRFDLVISDLTWPRTPEEARFHTVGWYERLVGLLAERGVLALNAASPSATPEAYWAMANGLRAAGLHVRPYRVALPSFRSEGYGDDWGMLLGSREPLVLPADGALPEAAWASRRALKDVAAIRRMFYFPGCCAALAATVAPAATGGRLHELLSQPSQALEPGFDWEAELAPHDGPAALDDRGLPEPLRHALALAASDERGGEGLLDEVLALVPGLQRESTRRMVEAFIEAPGRFLAAIDLKGLVRRLLARAAELPARFAAELEHLSAVLADAAPRKEDVMRAGWRLLAVVTVVVVVGNLLHPDSVYGKSTFGLGSSHSSSYGGMLHADQGSHASVGIPSRVTNDGFRAPLRRNTAVDEWGSVFSVRPYRIIRIRRVHTVRDGGQPLGDGADFGNDLSVVYQLTPEVGMLADGRLVMDLDDRSFFLLGDGPLPLIDRTGGTELMTLAPQPALTWRLARELERQQRGLQRSLTTKQGWLTWFGWLDFMPYVPGDLEEAQQLEAMLERFTRALAHLPRPAAVQPDAPSAPDPAAQELFNGAWIMPGGTSLAVKLEDGGMRYLDPQRGFFKDAGRTVPGGEACPQALKDALAHHLAKMVGDRDASRKGIDSELNDAQTELEAFQKDSREYGALTSDTGLDAEVSYGSDNVTLREAIERSVLGVERMKAEIAALATRQARFDSDFADQQRLLAAFTLAGAKP